MMHLSILIFIIGVCGCLGGDRNVGYRNRHWDRRNQELGYDIVGSDYDEERVNIWRPCSLKDYDCMGDFLFRNGRCVRHEDSSAPDPIDMPIEKFSFPVAAMTITHMNPRITGFRNAKVSEFYVNKDTGNLVIAVYIPVYNFSSHAFFTYRRAAQESITLDDFNTFEQDNVLLTATIPKVHNLRLDLADIHISTPDIPPRYYIGPGATKSHDPAVTRGMARFEANVIQVIREAAVRHSYFLMSLFIQKELCDFGIESYESYNGYSGIRNVVTRKGFGRQ